MKSRQAIGSVIVSFFLLILQICSAGRICYGESDIWRFGAVRAAVGSIPVQYVATYFCLFCANTLTILGICDLVLGYVKFLQRIAHRQVTVQEPPPTRWQRFTSFCQLCCNETTEPFLILVLMFTLQDAGIFSSPRLLGEMSVPVRLFCISGMLHLVKWFLQALEIFKNLREADDLKRPIVLSFGVVLTVYAVIWLHGATIVEDMIFASSYFGARWFNYGIGRSYFVRKRTQRLGQNMGVNMVRVADTVVTKWVQPTDMAYSYN